MSLNLTVLMICMIVVSSSLNAESGYFCVPVADLVAQPFTLMHKKSIADCYDEISISPERGKDSCLRLHQGIFNEHVTILGYENEQVYVELSNCFSQSMPSSNPIPTRFWTRADWVVSEQQLAQLGISNAIFPKPLHFSDCLEDAQECVTLILPWYDAVTSTNYSAGTRFVIQNKNHTEGYSIVLYNRDTQTVVSTTIPKTFALPMPFKTAKEQRKAFVELLTVWCSLDGSIPFVWGGTSFSYVCSNNQALLQEEYRNGILLAYWNRPAIKQHPYSGFDSSGIILRAAQIVGASYFCINSLTAAHHLKPLQEGDVLEEGDLLWAPGYLAIVGSFERNEIIEAQGYARGYGKVHMLALKDKFAGISSWDDFLYYYENGLPLQSLNSDGLVINSTPKYTLFKFPSKNNVIV